MRNNDKNNRSGENPTVQLAQKAAEGDDSARKEVAAIADPMIVYQTDKFCKRYCHDNRFQYTCTLQNPWSTSRSDAVYCEWGNASYGWMLADLTNTNRLRRFSAKDGANLGGYFFSIANSLPFYERWKNWRFGRRVHVPTYIKELGPEAGRIFLALRNGDNIAHIAQNFSISQNNAEQQIQQIICELTQRSRLYLLDPPMTVSLTSYTDSTDHDDEANQGDIVWHDNAPEDDDMSRLIREGWSKLTAVEQFVLEAMLIDEQDAEDVINALKTVGLSFKEGQSPETIDRQQLYYFRRKAVAKLAKVTGLS